MLGRRGEDALTAIAIEDVDEDPFADSRIAPVRQLVQRFMDACENRSCPSPGVAEGYRVQCLIDAARRAHATGRWIDVAPPAQARAAERTVSHAFGHRSPG
jgi:predicted dehydrogenase